MVLDANGNLGIGVTPSAWSGQKVLQLGPTASLSGSFGTTYLSNNSFFDGNFRYQIDGFATQYLQQSGGHYWINADYGNVGDIITFTDVMALHRTGNLTLGGPGPFLTDTGERLQIAGTQITTDTRTYTSGAYQSDRVVKNLTFPVGTSLPSGGFTFNTSLSVGTTNFQDSITIPNSNVFSTYYAGNVYAINSAGATITSQQAGGLRTLSQNVAQNLFGGTNNGTFTHVSSIQILGFFNNNDGIITPTITNAYQLLINNIDDYTHSFTFTNRWGIYQEGANDRNYFAGNLLIGNNSDSGEKLQVNGNAKIAGILTINTSGQGTTISTYYGANSLGLNIFIGGGGALSVGAIGLTYQGSSNTSLGVEAFLANTTGYYNVAVGYRSLYANTTGYQNTGSGYFSLYSNTDGFRNTAFGINTLVSNTTGSNNTAIGFRAGGAPGGLANTTGSNNIFIGSDITGVSATESNRTWIGSSTTTSTWLAGNLLLGSTTNGAQRLQVTGTSLFAGNVSLTLNQNGVTLFNVTNTTAGTISFASIRATSSNGYFEFSKQSSSTNAYKIFAANDSYIYNLTSGDISILNDVAAGRIKFAAGGSSVAQMTLTSAGNLCIGVTSGTDLLNIGASTATRAQVNLTAGVAPTLPNDGDIWFDGTDLKMQIGGVVKTFTLV
jgi:hypothetical protein